MIKLETSVAGNPFSMTPPVDLRGCRNGYYRTTIFIEGVGEVEILATKDFEIRDPWSLRVMIPSIQDYQEKGWFDNAFVMELGIGDSRNILHAGNSMSHIVGVDINEAKIEYARRNIQKIGPRYKNIPIELYSLDAVEFLTQWAEARQPTPDRILMCLPQSHGAGSCADVFENKPAYENWTKWNPYALTLNAAVLANLHEITHENTRILAVFSDRIPNDIIAQMFSETGWHVVQIANKTRVQQDPDTDLSWMLNAFEDDGESFFDKKGDPVTIEDAVSRVRNCDGTRGALDLYHFVTVYELAPIISAAI